VTGTLTIRVAGREDVPEMLEVMRLSLGETPLLRRTPDLFAWKHYDNAFGESLILVAEEGGRVVGLRAFMRWELETPDGERLRCVRAVDTATHPDFQGRGIFRELTLAAVEAAQADGIDLIFNTPNEKSAPGYLKMGWSEVGWIGPLVRPRLGPAVRAGSDGMASLDLLLPGTVPFQPGSLTRRPPLGLRTPRTDEYQRWRFLGHPTAAYGWFRGPSSEGAVVRASVRSGRTEVLISELSGSEACVRLVRKSHRARYVATSATEIAPEHRAARDAGLVPPPRVKGLRLVVNPLGDPPMDVADLASWDLTLSDLELL
jgi:GNAT superfamily N-acetyltransferase